MNARLREAAATLCSAYASNSGFEIAEIINSIGLSWEANDIASDAWFYSISNGAVSDDQLWAEACSLLRSGEFKGCR